MPSLSKSLLSKLSLLLFLLIFTLLYFIFFPSEIFAWDTCSVGYSCVKNNTQSACIETNIKSTCGWEWGTRYNLGTCKDANLNLEIPRKDQCIASSEACCEPGQNSCPCTGYLS